MLWGVLAVAALLWPSRLSSGFDGIPLDHRLEAIALGVVVPALLWLHARFLRSTVPRVCIAALLLIKVAAAFTLVQDGWCLTFEPDRPMVRESRGKPHAWDIRADWLSPDPVCSAVMTRSYANSGEFPVWFFNLAPPNDATTTAGYQPGQIPVKVRAHGFIDVGTPGTLHVASHPAMSASLRIDDEPAPANHDVLLGAGVHRVEVEAWLSGKVWSLVPSWDGLAMGSIFFPPTTMERPSQLDLLVRPAANWAVAVIACLLILLWLRSCAMYVGDRRLLAWCAVSAVCVADVGSAVGADAHWYALAPMALAFAVPIPRRLMNLPGAFLLIGVPWLTYVAAANAGQIARWTSYGVGNDNFQFQRFAYRIYLQGHWLEGGQPVFWNQPLFRWMAGALHLVFGDSSVGQAYWDAAWLLVMSLFAYHVTRRVAGHRWGLLAAIVPLAMCLLGPTLEFVGFGLSEISSAGLLSLAACFAMRGRSGRLVDAIAAGVLATLAFYTRLNNFPMACAVMVFALPLPTPVRFAVRPTTWWRHISWTVVTAVVASLGVGLLLFAWRTWYYTGVFSVFHGTQRDLLAVWKPGMPLATAIERMAGSVLMVLTASDPPAFAWHALPIMIAAVASLGALCGVKGLRDLPLPLVLFFVSGCTGALMTRGWAYEGRFSIHLFGIASALSVCVLAQLARTVSGGTVAGDRPT